MLGDAGGGAFVAFARLGEFSISLTGTPRIFFSRFFASLASFAAFLSAKGHRVRGEERTAPFASSAIDAVRSHPLHPTGYGLLATKLAAIEGE